MKIIYTSAGSFDQFLNVSEYAFSTKIDELVLDDTWITFYDQ